MDNYVYIHKTNLGEIFYVGKGSGKRAYNLASRSIYHKKIAKKHGCQVIIAKNNLTEDEAYELEALLIKEYKKIGLCRANFVLTGGGRRGLKHSQKTKDKMRLAHLGHVGYNKGMKMSKESSIKKSIFMKSSGTNCKAIKCLNTNEIFQSLSAAVLHFNLSGTSNLAKVLKGTRNHINGLRFEYVK